MFENISLALQGIFSHKLRSLLTMLGIIIGIAAIITIVSTIKGTNEQISKARQSWHTPLIPALRRQRQADL